LLEINSLDPKPDINRLNLKTMVVAALAMARK
jgi:hypothetical protein